MICRKCLWFWLVLLSLSCTEGDPPSPPEMAEIMAGELCHSSVAECRDEGSLLWCADVRWTLTDCAAYCGSLGVGVTSSGCDTTLAIGAPAQLCNCEPPPDGCYPQQGMCESEDALMWCTDGYSWTTTSCTSLCEAQALLSLGCESVGDSAVCMCTNTGAPCAGEPPVCADLTTLSACQNGVWELIDCADACGGPGSCNPATSGGAACACG